MPTNANQSKSSNYSMEFDAGSSDYIACGTSFNSSLELGDSFSFSAWVKFSADTTNRQIVSNMTSGSLGVSLRVMATEALRLSFAETGSDWFAVDSSVLAVDTWHHVSATYDGSGVVGGMNMYVNGVLDNNATAGGGTVTTITSTDPFYIGTFGGASQDFEGNISNVALWYSELSLANIIILYNNRRLGDLSSFSPAPVSWWKLGNDAFATAASPTAWTIPDQISTNDGTSAGNPVISGDAPGSNANGLSFSMDIEDRIGESGFSDSNAQSYNMPEDTRKAY